MLKSASVGVTIVALAFATAAQAAPSPNGARIAEQVVNIPFGPGPSHLVLYDAPERPRATLVVLPGGSGDLGLQPDGRMRHSSNFVVRTRADWVARGYAVVISDTVNGFNMRGRRGSADYADVVEGLAAHAQSRVRAPVFLLGTSQGTIAAMNGAAHARPGLIAGVVLTESVSVPGRLSSETVFDADRQNVRVPALVVANRDDACDVAPPLDGAPHRRCDDPAAQRTHPADRWGSGAVRQGVWFAHAARLLRHRSAGRERDRAMAGDARRLSVGLRLRPPWSTSTTDVFAAAFLRMAVC